MLPYQGTFFLGPYALAVSQYAIIRVIARGYLRSSKRNPDLDESRERYALIVMLLYSAMV